jgi:hypothetical protein
VSTPLAAMLRALEQAFPDLEEVVRVDVEDGGGLGLTATGAGATRWFRHDERGLSECFPTRDARLPLAGWLQANRGWRVLSYRPGRRVVVLASGEGEPRVFKGHKKGRSERAAARQRIAEGAMRHGAFRVPRLARRDAEHEALVFDFLAGEEVALGRESVPAYARLGQQLSVFQRERAAAELEVFGVPDELEVLARWQGKVVQALGALPEGWSAAHARLLQYAAALPAPELGLCHRDLHDRQVHLARGTDEDVAVLDFDLLCRADVALDPGNLSAHLRWRGHQGLYGADEAGARSLNAAFLGALARDQEPGFRARLAFYSASAFLRLALVYRLRPRWSAGARELIAWAHESLDDLVPTP